MKLIHVFFLLIFSCSFGHPVASPKDDFDKIIEIMKTKSVSDLTKFYGKPDEIKVPEQDTSFKILIYKKSRIDAYIKTSNEKKLSHLTLFFFEDFDNYTFLKKRFRDYKWVEKKISDPVGDVATDLYLVTIPEIRMKFEYDNYAPKRKVMWIYFE